MDEAIGPCIWKNGDQIKGEKNLEQSHQDCGDGKNACDRRMIAELRQIISRDGDKNGKGHPNENIQAAEPFPIDTGISCTENQNKAGEQPERTERENESRHPRAPPGVLREHRGERRELRAPHQIPDEDLACPAKERRTAS